MAGIVTYDLCGGDARWDFVDDLLWEQITGLMKPLERTEAHELGRAMGRVQSYVEWLTRSEEPDSPRPAGCPDRCGRVLKTVYVQARTFTPELVLVEDVIVGVVSF